MKLITNQSQIEFIAAVLTVKPEVWVHGDGNVFYDLYNSDKQKNWSSPSKPEATYVLHFSSANELPKNPAEFEKMFHSTKSGESNIIEEVKNEQVAIKMPTKKGKAKDIDLKFD